MLTASACEQGVAETAGEKGERIGLRLLQLRSVSVSDFRLFLFQTGVDSVELSRLGSAWPVLVFLQLGL